MPGDGEGIDRASIQIDGQRVALSREGLRRAVQTDRDVGKKLAETIRKAAADAENGHSR